jgi:hypothetical protein
MLVFMNKNLEALCKSFTICPGMTFQMLLEIVFIFIAIPSSSPSLTDTGTKLNISFLFWVDVN